MNPVTTQKFDKVVFAEVLAAIAKHRRYGRVEHRCVGHFAKYRGKPGAESNMGEVSQQFAYAENIEYESIIVLLETPVEKIIALILNHNVL